MDRKMVTIDGNTAAAYADQATNEATAIYPIKRLRSVSKHVKWERSVKLNFGNIKRQYFYLSFIFSILIFPTLAVADGGMVIWPPPVHLDQTAQNAIVAWNGEEEIIILSNNIKSDSKATVLRIVPLPSNPTEIKEADPNCFEKLVELMNEKLKAIRPIPPGVPAPPGPPVPPGGIEIIFHEKIGAHDVTVVKVNNIDYFLNWIKNFAQDKGLQVKEISQTFIDGVANYLKRQIEYFVFDVIEPEAGEESIKPLIYRFDCDCLYYPLLISGISEISESWAKINLFLITPKEAVLFDPPYSYYRYHWFYSYGFPVEFTEEELQEVSEDLRDLFEGPVKARKASLYDKLNQLTRDLSLYPYHFWNKDLTLGSSGEEVKALQKILINEGLWDSDQKVTGYFGPVTKDALAKFQEKYLGLSSGTGYFDRETREYFKQLSIKLCGQIIYVDADANGANDGSSWADAYEDLKYALAFAYSGDEIRVAQGIYKPAPPGLPPQPPTPPPTPPPTGLLADRTATFQLKNGVAIKGGYAGFGTPDPNARDIDAYETILSGDLAGNDRDVNDPQDLLNDPCRAENRYHVVTAGGTNEMTVLDGFTITAGNANGSWSDRTNRGGGMYNGGESSPTLTNCIFSENSAAAGGAMFTEESSPSLVNCIFNGNLATGLGGGMCNYESEPTLTNCTFIGNSVKDDGGAIYNYNSNPIISNCTITTNSAGVSGGGIYNSGSSPTLTNCTFSGNLAGFDGGGMSSYDGSATLTNCIFSGNSAKYGGGMDNIRSAPVLTNCTLTGNRAWYGGGIYYQFLSYPPPPPPPPGTFADKIVDGTAAENADTDTNYYSGVHNIIITNCILWSNEAPDGPQIYLVSDSNAWVSYSDVQGGWPGEGDIDADPLFVEAGYWDANGFWVEGDYHLLGGSPCINAGDPNYSAGPNDTDLDGKPRVISGLIDMGAYEFFNTPPVADAGPEKIVECACNTNEGTKVTLDGTGSYDVDGDAITYTWTGPFIESPAQGATPTVTLEDGCPGGYVITLVVNDGTEDSEPNDVLITVVDTTPPEFALSVNPTTLWPPNNKIVKITPTWTVSDKCDAIPGVSLVSISINESKTKGNGRTDDVKIGDDGSIYLRAERSGKGSDRIYTITYKAVDNSGNAIESSATVTVPHDRR